jgi:putative peptidoglycan lipid II flippase
MLHHRANFLAAPLAVVAYPYFAREALRENHGELRGQLSHTLPYVVFLFLPATVWTVLNALPITRALYERGQFRPEDSVLIARVLKFYSIGILPNAIAVILMRCFYALEDTITPMWTESVNLIFFVPCATWLTHRFGIAGLAFTRGMTYFLVAMILTLVLSRRRKLLQINRDDLRFFAQTAIATGIMAIVNWTYLQIFRPSFERAGTVVHFLELASLLFIGVVAFLGRFISVQDERSGNVVSGRIRFVRTRKSLVVSGVTLSIGSLTKRST